MFYSVTLLVFFFDLILKLITLKFMLPGQTIILIENLLHITYVQNYGSAFGYFRDQRLFLSVVGLIICGLVLYFYFRSNQKEKLLTLSFALIMGGSIGNLVNRIFLGYVIDYVDLRIFPVFNLADIAINIGVALIIFEMIFRGKECIQ